MKKIFLLLFVVAAFLGVVVSQHKVNAGVLLPEAIFLKTMGSSGSANGQFNSPQGITTDVLGNVYVADTGNHRIQVFDSTGAFVFKYGSNIAIPDMGFTSLVAVAVSPVTGDIYLLDAGANNEKVIRLNASGVIQGQFGGTGTGDGYFDEPRGITVSASGLVYVADTGNHRIQEFSATGVFQRSIGSYGPVILLPAFPQFDSPEAVAVDATGYMYVADTGNNRVVVVDPSGNSVTRTFGTVGSANGQFDMPTGITLSSNGSIYVTDKDNHRIQMFSNSGAFLMKFGTYGTGNGQMSSPNAMTIDLLGNIYVADSGNNRVQKFLDHTPVALMNVYVTFAKYRYNKYVSPSALMTGDTAYIKNFDQSKLRLLQVFLYDYAKKGNQGYTKSRVTSTSMFLRTNYTLPTGKRYAYVFKFQDKATGIVATKYFVVYTTKTWLGRSTL